MSLQRIVAMLQTCTSGAPLFPPALLLYNEGWLLRLALDWFARHDVPGHPLAVPPGARWFSEALLPTAFAARYKGDPLAEAWTHADGAVGHFAIGREGRTDLSLEPDATHLVVLEAKLFSPLSAGVSNAPYFDQAARSVACLAEALRRAGRRPSQMSRLGFHVLAPSSQAGLRKWMTKESVRLKVEKRVAAYQGERDQWFSDWFLPALQRIELGVLTWEGIITTIREHDPGYADALARFYRQCLAFNAAASSGGDAG